MPLPPLGSILVAHKPIDGPKRDYCRSKGEQFLRCVSNVEDQQLAQDGKHCNQDHGTNPDDVIDHLGISVGSIARATEFYLKALAPLGYGIVMEVSAEETGHGAAIAFGAPGQAADFQSGKPSFWVG